ncbi:hypothetical protein K3F44_18230 [Pseudomonas sp. S07E 245]|uniref:hypothetical protein n=1 Tax=Pseudomonas sp. S07E 245 TaxID=2866278 RepID=UPI001C73B6B8|nr:hypothetical protein [Pseudomonas sp. S07E 245]QYX51529.1 hypothetical protein K3F44_18230 [Pseudomonas sp. S07E 245]
MSNADLDSLNMELAFQAWAEDRGYDLKTGTDGNFTNIETRAAWLGFEAAHGPAGCMSSGQQLFAQIKECSEYAHQTDQMFPVSVGQPSHGDYAVVGGPGGVYRLRDVDLFVVTNGKQTQLK